ncbi:MAG TPA: hypothetical protein VGB30_13795 [bacterium]
MLRYKFNFGLLSALRSLFISLVLLSFIVGSVVIDINKQQRMSQSPQGKAIDEYLQYWLDRSCFIEKTKWGALDYSNPGHYLMEINIIQTGGYTAKTLKWSVQYPGWLDEHSDCATGNLIPLNPDAQAINYIIDVRALQISQN